jgi:hypothetical protein
VNDRARPITNQATIRRSKMLENDMGNTPFGSSMGLRPQRSVGANVLFIKGGGPDLQGGSPVRETEIAATRRNAAY